MEKFFREVREKDKMEAHLHANPAMRGYEPLGETGRGRRGGEFFYPFFPISLTNLSHPDLKEAFTIGDCVHDSEQVSFYQSLYPHLQPPPSIPRSQNIWPKPSSAPGFREGMYAYYREIFPVAMKLVEIFGVALGVDSHDENENENGGGDGGLEKDFQWPIWGMRALHYPPPPICAEEEKEGGEGEGDGDGDGERMGLGAHKDFSWVTLVLQDEVGGLEVLNSEGKWIDVPPREGTLVVNVGQVSFFFVFFTLFFLFFLLLLFSLFFTFSLFLPPFPTKSQISNLSTPPSPFHNKLILLPLLLLPFQYLEHQTNSLFPATIHRVRNKSGQEQKRRYSIPFFLSPNPQATLKVLPNCVKAGEEIPPAINVGDLYIRRVLPARKKHPTSVKWRNVPETEWKYEILYGVE